AFTIGPGVAPKADLYAYRVFGCTGSTNVTVDAINMAFNDGMDVINMSLGSPFGTANDASAVASTNVAKAGMIVVSSAGNSGPNQYITGSPASGTGTISIAANDAHASFPGATMVISSPANTITAQNSNGATFTNGTSLTVAVLRTSYPNGTISLGCSDADYTNYPGGVSGKLVVTLRGTCSRVGRAIRAQQAGAAAAAMINNAAGYPPFEGQITSDPDTGFQFTVTIPFFGIRGAPATDGSKLASADTANPPTPGGTVTLTNTTIANPTFSSFASFTSGGPRNGDSWLKPDVTAPGVSVFSTLMGSGNQATALSGTSMSSPHVAGVAALVKQAHPTWNQVQEWKAAIVNTGSPSAIGGITPYRTSRGGTGLVQPIPAVNTNVIALGDTATSTLNFGFSELKADFSQTKAIKLRNKGASPATFNIAQTNAAGRPHSIVLGSSSVTIPAGTEVTVNVTLNVPVATAGDSNGSGLSFREVAGLITFTPATPSDNNNVKLRVPYYLVPRALSGVNATMPKSVTTASPSTNVTLSNPSGPISGNADFYAWGLNNSKKPGANSANVRGIGVQSFPFGGDQLLVFAVNAWNRSSNAATNEFDIYVDVDGDGIDDYIVVGVDFGAVTAGSFNGRMAAFVFSTNPSNPGATVNFFATAPTDSSTVLLPILASGSPTRRSASTCSATSSTQSPGRRSTTHTRARSVRVTS
ncbi:MAG: peptidase S8 and S53 subtilisin kexin sedolisin, partial [Gemmatimonadetes bacterium]